MISFENINKFDPLYQFLNNYFRWAHNHLYYKKIQIIGYENMPPKGYPIFAISNHQNGLMDPLAMLYLYKDHRQPVFIARGDIFKKSDFVAKLLRFLKILPTFRTRDGGRDDVKSNLATFDLAARILNEGGTLTMFPEAGHQAGKFFSTFKKGFPRVAFRAAEISNYQLDFKILPMYIYYTNYFSIRNEQVVVIGQPFAIDEFYELYQSEPNKAYAAMNEKAREAVRSMGVDVTDHEHYVQYDMIFTVCRSAVVKREGWNPKEPYSSLKSDKLLVEQVDAQRQDHPEQFEKLMAMATEYREGLSQLKLRDWLFDQPSLGKAVALKSLRLALTAPLALFGLIHNFIPFRACELLKRKSTDPMFKSSLNFAVSAIVTFPIAYISLFILVCCLANWWVALLYLAAAFLTLPCYYGWKIGFIKLMGMCRFRKLSKAGNAQLKKLAELREEIRKMLVK
ncbi:MAG: 1-acyl-sn-glycerol-3-phosphate acyltransferase [Bacteroidales bacterium]|nr:1-acyl-sn-glycerol-3-phosphate acyltransferase [Bacteroidales bacterium]